MSKQNVFKYVPSSTEYMIIALEFTVYAGNELSNPVYGYSAIKSKLMPKNTIA